VSDSQNHSLEKSRTFQDLALKFPGLPRIKPIFQDFPEPGNFILKIQDFPGDVGNLAITTKYIMPENKNNLM